MDGWVETIVAAAAASHGLDGRYGEVRRVLIDARSSELPDEQLVPMLVDQLRIGPAAILDWQNYSWDKRWSPSPYLEGLEVGLFDGERRDVQQFEDAASACAAFIVRERDWMVELAARSSGAGDGGG